MVKECRGYVIIEKGQFSSQQTWIWGQTEGYTTKRVTILSTLTTTVTNLSDATICMYDSGIPGDGGSPERCIGERKRQVMAVDATTGRCGNWPTIIGNVRFTA